MVGAYVLVRHRTGWSCPVGFAMSIGFGVQHGWEQSLAFDVHFNTHLEYSIVNLEGFGYNYQWGH